MKKFRTRIISLMLVVSVLFSFNINVFAADDSVNDTEVMFERIQENERDELRSVTSLTLVYTKDGWFSGTYKGFNITLPSTGTYKVYYSVRGIDSTSDKYSFTVNSTTRYNITADGTAYTMQLNCTSTLMQIGILTYSGNRFAYAIDVYKVS